MRSLRIEAAVCSSRFSRHGAPFTTSRFALRAAVSLNKAGLRGVARSFRKTLAFESSEGLLETWTFFCARSRRDISAFSLQHVACQSVWVQARRLRPRASTWWQSFVRLKSSTGISGDVTHTFANIRVPSLWLNVGNRRSRACSAHRNTFFKKIGCGVLSFLRRCLPAPFGIRSTSVC